MKNDGRPTAYVRRKKKTEGRKRTTSERIRMDEESHAKKTHNEDSTKNRKDAGGEVRKKRDA